jgi:hypothetical protein
MSSNGWDTVVVVCDTISAHALLGRLASEGVTARLECDTALLGAARQCRILVPAESVRLAKCVLWQSSFSEQELANLATACDAPGGTAVS